MKSFAVVSLLFGYGLSTSGDYQNECDQNCDNQYWDCYMNNWETCYNQAQQHPYVDSNCFDDCTSKSHQCLADLNCFNQYDCYMNGDVWGCSDCVYKCGYEQTCVDSICKPQIESCHQGCSHEDECTACNDQITACIAHAGCADVIQQIDDGNVCDDPTWCFNPDNQLNLCNQDVECQQHFGALASCFEQNCYQGGGGEQSGAGGESSSYYGEESSSYYDPYTSGESSYYDPYATSSYYDPYVDPYATSSYYDPYAGGESSYYDPYYMPPNRRYRRSAHPLHRRKQMNAFGARHLYNHPIRHRVPHRRPIKRVLKKRKTKWSPKKRKFSFKKK